MSCSPPAKHACWMGNDTSAKEVDYGSHLVKEEFSLKEEKMVEKETDAVKEELMTVTEDLFRVNEDEKPGVLTSNSLQLFLTVSAEEVLPEQQHCKQEWSSSFGQDDHEPAQIKEEPKELRICQEKLQLQGPVDTKDFICVRNERQNKDSLCESIPADYPTLWRLEISRLESFHVILNDRLTMSAAVEVFGAVEKTVAKYEWENDQLRKLLRITPETKPCKTEPLRFFFTVTELALPAEQRRCKREWETCLGLEDPELTRINEERKELRSGQNQEQPVGFCGSDDPISPHPCVKTAAEVLGVVEKMLTEYEEENDWLRRLLCITPSISLHRLGSRQYSLVVSEDVSCERQHCKREPAQIKEEPKELRIGQEKRQLQGLVDAQDFILTPPCVKKGGEGQEDSEPGQIKEERRIGQEGEQLQRLFENKRLKRKRCQEDQPNSALINVSRCRDKDKMFTRNAGHQGRVTASKERPIECDYCRKCFSSPSKLKVHFRLRHRGKPCACKYCGKSFKLKGDLSKHAESVLGLKEEAIEEETKVLINTPGLSDAPQPHLYADKAEKCHSRLGNQMDMAMLPSGNSLLQVLKRVSVQLVDYRKAWRRSANEMGEENMGAFLMLRREQLDPEQPKMSRPTKRHIDEKAFHCSLCVNSLTNIADFKGHERTHTGGKPNHCSRVCQLALVGKLAGPAVVDTVNVGSSMTFSFEIGQQHSNLSSI
ncbi:hypothetical protein DPEC_G00356430 [Dallia pectoralis]|uniref:Uncharacterized protein n=1 Tax=Dallia pectoralis TaxID=75939 RepID=A0ACC2EZR2_DALPE|nr:hypothetical protein DPEC_G00356430 [Dallia pectoralis]